MKYGRLACGALVATAVSAPALAAPAPAPSRHISVEISGEVQYDSDLPRVSEQEAALRHQTMEDTTYLPSLNFDVLMPVGRQALFLTGSAAYAYHENNSILDSERITVLGGTDLHLGHCNVRLSGNYNRALSDYEDITAPGTITNILEDKRVALDGSCPRRTGLGLTGSVSHEEANNDTVLLKPQDHTSDTYSGGLTYSRPGLGVLTVFGSHTITDYQNRLTLFGGHDGYDVDAGGITVDRRLGARIEGTVTLSYTKVDSHAPQIAGLPSSNFSGATWSADVTYRPTHRLRGELLVERAVVPSNRIGSNYDLRTSYRLLGSYRLTPRLELHGSGEQRKIDSTTNLPLTVNALTNSTTNVGSVGVRYDLNRRVFFGLDGGVEQRSTNNVLYNYHDTHVAVSAHYRY
jgi:hypothetical protein